MRKTLLKRKVRDDLIEKYMDDPLYIQDDKDSNIFYPKNKEALKIIMEKINESTL